jgi:hypothetical protein
MHATAMIGQSIDQLAKTAFRVDEFAGFDVSGSIAAGSLYNYINETRYATCERLSEGCRCDQLTPDRNATSHFEHCQVVLHHCLQSVIKPEARHHDVCTFQPAPVFSRQLD